MPLLFQSAEIAPSGRHFAVATVSDEILESGFGLLLTIGVLIVLDAVQLYSAVVLRESEIVSPSLSVRLDRINRPALKYEM